MKMAFKKSLASIMSVVSLAMCVTSMSASAISQNVHFTRDAGSPGGAGVISAFWNYTTTKSTSTITVENFTVTNGSTYIGAYIAVDSIVKASGAIYPSGGSVSATNLVTGRPAYASAYIVNVSGSISADVSISG